VRYCDDFVMTFEVQDDAERVMEVLGKRMGRYGLTLHPATDGEKRPLGAGLASLLVTASWRAP